MLYNTVILSTLISSATLVSAYAVGPGPNRMRPRADLNATRTINKRATAGAAVVPADWPTVTQSGPVPSITVANSADPNLNSLSYALNNNGNSLWTTKYSGDLTYYDTGSVACGDTYTDSTYTAAISHLMYDQWPGATANVNRNPVCGPWTPGRIVNGATTVSSSDGMVTVGGDGLPNCTAGSKCHIPLTATVTNPATGKSVVVQIVDRCGGCAMGDIDLTPTAFSAIADMNSGRVHGIQWSFNAMSNGSNPPPPPKTTTTTTPPPPKTTSTTPVSPPKTTTSTPPSSGGSCSGVSPWSAQIAYTGGQTVTYGGALWKANWWSQADVPGGASGDWTKVGTC